MTSAPDRLSAALVHRYRIERELGAGGMATVYLAQDLKHHRQVAIKVLRPELAAVLGADRFVQEIQTTAALQHPHILPLFDSGEADGFLFYVMPYVEGETLRDKLNRETQFSIDDAVRITTDVADALDYAHRHGVVHRDIKPENILLHDGRPMVADFGIALALSAAAGGRMTETGMSLGTPHYMSPEQATADKDITGRSDIYSLASVLYEMLTGEPPHMGNSAQQIIMKIVTDQARPVTELRKSVPVNVAGALAKALEKLPADRFDSAKAFAEALTNPSFTVASAFSATPAALRRSRTTTYTLGATTIVVAALALWGWLRSPPTAPVTRFRIALTKDPIETGWVGRDLTLSPDGETIVFVDSADRGHRLWIKTIDRADAVPITGTDGASGPTFSPDGQWIAFVADGKLRKVPRSGGSPVTVADSAATGSIPPSAAWLDNGTIAFTDRRFGLTVVGQDGGVKARFDYLATTGRGVATIGALRGGHEALLGMCNFACPAAALYVADLTTGKLDSLVDGAVRAWQLADGRIVFARLDGGVFMARFDAGTRRFTSAPAPVLDGVRTLYYWPDMALAPNGTLLYVTGPAGGGGSLSEAVWVTRDGRATPVDSGWAFAPSGNGGIRLSPDGRRLAVSVVSEGREEVWIKQLTPGGPFVRLSLETAALRPEWSADGRFVYYFGESSANSSDLRRRRANVTGSADVLFRGTRAVWEMQPTADTNLMIIRLGIPPSRDIYLLDRTKGNGDSAITPLVADDRYEETSIALSPNQRWLAYTSNEAGRYEVYVRPYPNVNAGRWQISGEGGSEPRWAHSGRELFYHRADGNLVSVTVSEQPTFTPGAQHVLFSVAAFVSNPAYPDFDVSPDDRRFAFLRPVAPAVGTETHTAILVQHWLTDVDARQPTTR
jgi:serine/threonine-protein kinase